MGQRIGAGAMAQVEADMIGEVERRGLVGSGGVVEVQDVVVGEGVHRRHGQVTGVAFFVGGTVAGQHQGFASGGSAGHGLPDALVEADITAVQGVGPVIGGELVRLAIERELALGNAVTVAPNQRPKVGVGLAEGRALVTAHILKT